MIWGMEVIGGIAAFIYYLHLYTDLLKPKVTSRLNPDTYTPFKLISITKDTADTSIFRFEIKRPRFDDEQEKLVDKIMSQGAWAVDVKDHLVQTFRTYTPVAYHMGTEVDEETGARTGYIDLVVKRYPRGSLSRFIHGTRVDDQIEMRGPILTWPYKPSTHGHIYMIAGGTGIAPMLQIIERVMSDPEDKTKISLLYGSPSEDSIIMRSHIDKLRAEHGDRLRVSYLVNNVPVKDGDNVQIGVPNTPVIEQFTRGFDKSASDIVLVCGPDPMMHAVSGVRPVGPPQQGPLQGALRDLGFGSESVFKF
ncbi:hypothetical protein FB645_000909 [Coemansia sp. IMI 203386]|nr:hypothetical protein FB645_000909 [Coemansia sp. IMI 203386]